MLKAERNNKLRVAILATNFPPIEGGISRYMSSLSKSLPNLDVTLFIKEDAQGTSGDEEYPIKIIRVKIPFESKLKLKALKFLAPFYFRALKKEGEFDWLILGQVHHGLMLCHQWVAKKHKGKTAVIVYGQDYLIVQQKSYASMVNNNLKQADLLLPISEATNKVITDPALLKIPRYILYPSISEMPPVDADQLAAFKAENGIGENVLLTVGRLVERKGHDMVIAALPEILKTNPALQYLIVGNGECEASLKAQVSSLGLNKQVHFFNSIEDKDLPLFYAAANIFIMPNRFIESRAQLEGFGMVFLEAALYKVPSIGGNSGGAKEAIHDGETGLLVDPENSSAVTHAVLQLLNDPEQLKKMGEAAYELATSKFTPAKIGGDFEKKLAAL